MICFLSIVRHSNRKRYRRVDEEVADGDLPSVPERRQGSRSSHCSEMSTAASPGRRQVRAGLPPVHVPPGSRSRRSAPTAEVRHDGGQLARVNRFGHECIESRAERLDAGLGPSVRRQCH